MRVSQRQQISRALHYIQEDQAAVDKARLQIASGKRIQAPEDDPAGSQQALNLRAGMAAVRGTLHNLDASEGWMRATTTSLTGLDKLMDDVRTQAQAALNGTQTAEDRRNLANQLPAVFRQVLDLANTDYNGQYVFAGQQVLTKPFAGNPADLTFQYAGDSKPIDRELEPGTQTTINVPGNPIFGSALDALKALHDGLAANDTDAVRAAIAAIDSSSEGTLAQVAQTGSILKEAGAIRTRLDDYDVRLQGLLSQIEDTDVPKTILEMSSNQQAYDATLTMLSKNGFTSLFDYLR